MTFVSIVYFSRQGHTKKQAEAVEAGLKIHIPRIHIFPIDAEGKLPDHAWEMLKTSHGIIFGTPTYMGGPAWQFKKFADASSNIWSDHAWDGKIAAGFTNSMSTKFLSIGYLVTLAMQHGMIWAGSLAQTPEENTSKPSFSEKDMETARAFGERMGLITKNIVGIPTKGI
jgi:NAD(P)H dehydrogenase (quinone)